MLLLPAMSRAGLAARNSARHDDDDDDDDHKATTSSMLHCGVQSRPVVLASKAIRSKRQWLTDSRLLIRGLNFCGSYVGPYSMALQIQFDGHG